MSKKQPHPLDDVAVYDSKGRPLAYDGNADDPRFVELEDARALAAEVARLTGELASGSFYKESDIDALMDRAKAADTARAEGVAEGRADALREIKEAVDAHSNEVWREFCHDVIAALIPAPAKPKLLDDCLGPRPVSTYLLRRKQMALNDAGNLDAAADLLAEAIQHETQALEWWRALQAQERAAQEGDG